MRNITDKEFQSIIDTTSSEVLDMVYADGVTLLIMRLAGEYGIENTLVKGIVIEEIHLLLLNICAEDETVERISERTGIGHESAVSLLNEFTETMTEEIIPELNTPEEDGPTLPIDQIPWEAPQETQKETPPQETRRQSPPVSQPIPEVNKNTREELVLRPKTAEVPKITSQESEMVLGTLPEANRAMREKLTLHPEGVTRAGLVRDPNTPLTREEVMSALAPRRTMASDIATLAKEKSNIQK